MEIRKAGADAGRGDAGASHTHISFVDFQSGDGLRLSAELRMHADTDTC